MKTEELIVELVRAARPVTPLAAPWARVVRWAAAGGAFVTLVVVAVGARPTLASDVARPMFLALAAATIACACLAAVAAVRSSVPGLDGRGIRRALPGSGLALWAGLLVVALALGGNALARVAAFPVHVGCIANVLAISALPGLILVTMIRRGAPLEPRRSAAWTALAATSLAAAAVQFICPIDDLAHHLVSHLAPVLVFAAVGATAGASTLTWIGRSPRR